MMTGQLSPQQVARAFGVSESSVKRWCDRGLIPTVKTAGGHRRIAAAEALEFMRKRGHELTNGDALGLPTLRTSGRLALGKAKRELVSLLVSGHEDECRRLIADACVAGTSMASLCDEVIAFALNTLGDLWENHELEIYQERLSCDICLLALEDCRRFLPPAKAGAPVAVGGTPECDPYQLPTRMAELVLREAGWRATSLGAGLPLSTLAAAAVDQQAQLVWLSVSTISSLADFQTEFQVFRQRLPKHCQVIAGGRALTPEVRAGLRVDAFGSSMQDLSAQMLSTIRSQTP